MAGRELRVYTTFEAAKICHVTHHSIKTWIKEGQIKASRTPGGHYRILESDLDAFREKNDMFPRDKGSHKKRIMVVDDDPDALALMDKILSDHGYEVIKVGRATETGLKAAQLSPDLILLDMLMPEINGFDVAKALRQNELTRTTPIMAVTILTKEQEIERMFECGIDEYLAKPYKVDTLLEKVRELVERGAEMESEDDTPPDVGQRKTIMMVDDDPDALSLMETILTDPKYGDQHYRLIKVSNATEVGLKAAQHSPDLILLDILMPEINGFDILVVLRQNEVTRTIPVMAVTCLTKEEEIERVFACGADEYLAKPFKADQLADRVRDLLERGRAEDEKTADSDDAIQPEERPSFRFLIDPGQAPAAELAGLLRAIEDVYIAFGGERVHFTMGEHYIEASAEVLVDA